MTKSKQLLIVTSLGLLIIIALGIGLFKTEHMTVAVSNQAETSVEVSLKIAQAHNSLHSAILDENITGLNTALAHLESADRYTTAILEGGRIKGNPVMPSTNKKSIESATAVRKELKGLKSMLVQIISSNFDSIQPISYDIFDVEFASVTTAAKNLEMALANSMESDISQLRSLQIGLIIVCLICLVVAIIFIRRNENLWLSHTVDLQETKHHLKTESSGRAAAEQSLIEKEHLLSTTLEATADGILVVDSNGVTKLANRQFALVWDIPDSLLKANDDDKMLSFVLDQLIDPEQFLSKVKALYQSAEEDTDTLYFKNGRIVQRFSRPLIDENKITGRVWSFRDITQQADAEQALINNEASYRATLNQMNSAITIHAADSSVLVANPEACRIFNKSEKQLRGMSFAETLWPFVTADNDTLPIDQYPVNKVIATLEPCEQQMIGIKSKDSANTIWVLSSAFPLHNDDRTNNRVVVTMTDISDIYQTSVQAETPAKSISTKQSEKLTNSNSLQTARLESAAKMAGQVAHDYNNLLGPLVAYPAMIRAELTDDHPAQELIDVIEQAASQIIDINQNLLSLGRRDNTESISLDLNETLTQSLKSFSEQHPSIIITTNMADRLAEISGQKTAIEKLFNILLENAEEAMTKGGKIIVASKLHKKEAIDDVPRQLPVGEYQKISFEDTGHGIDDESLPHIYEPFFTTKKIKRKRGSGIGLSVAYSIMIDHQGLIDISSQTGDGTLVHLYFPAEVVSESVPLSPEDEITIIQTVNS